MGHLFSHAGYCAGRDTSLGWVPASALELAGVFPLVGLAIYVSCFGSWNFVGVNRSDSALPSGWLKPSIVAGLFALAVPAVFFVLGARKKLDWEGWAFLLIMPGLAEELVFRGVYQSLLNRVFGKPWRLANAEFGWGLIITAILFAGFNGLVSVDHQLHARLLLPAAIAPFLSSLVSGWVRERTDSVWLCVFGHNLSNAVIPIASLFT